MRVTPLGFCLKVIVINWFSFVKRGFLNLDKFLEIIVDFEGERWHFRNPKTRNYDCKLHKKLLGHSVHLTSITIVFIYFACLFVCQPRVLRKLFCTAEARFYYITEAHFYCIAEARLYCITEARFYCITETRFYCITEARLYCITEARLYCIQGRIQDLSKRGARFISEQKNPDLWTKFFLDRYFLFCFALGFLSLKCYWEAILKSQGG